jgi:hypothetical protein
LAALADTRGMLRATTTIDSTRAAYGAVCLALGAAFYGVAREDAAWFLPEALHVPVVAASGAAAGFAGALPTFAHTAAFALLTACALGGARGRVLAACSAWAAVNVAFEAGQHPRASAWLAAHLPDWLDRVWLLDRTRGYFAGGTFDYYDVAAAVAGGLLAAAMTLALPQRGARRL